MRVIQVHISEEERQLVLLSLAILSLMRPGFNMALQETAKQFHGADMFISFRKANEDIVKPVGSLLTTNQKETVENAEHSADHAD